MFLGNVSLRWNDHFLDQPSNAHEEGHYIAAECSSVIGPKTALHWKIPNGIARRQHQDKEA